jgi:tetratricopeptide (TPR) repeat protein
MAKATWLTRRAWAASAVLISILLLVPEGHALAQGAPTAAQAEAVEFYRSGREHFEAGRYREAITDLERAVSLDPNSPTLVYNVARVYELLGNLEQAIRYYLLYLRMLSNDEGDERVRVADTIERLQGAQDQVSTVPEVSPDQTPQLDRPVIVQQRGVADVAFWVTTASAAALLVGGGILGAVALLNDGNADCVVGDNCTLIQRDNYASAAEGAALTADILFITGGVAALSAILLYALRTHPVETYPQYEGTTAFISTDGNGAFVGVAGGF